MSFNRNPYKARLFKNIDIDTSNWPEQHKFISTLPNNVNDFNEVNWLGLMFPNKDYQTKFDSFLAARRTLSRMDLLADYNSYKSNISEGVVLTNLQNIEEINPYAGASLALAYTQINNDIAGITDTAIRVSTIRDGESPPYSDIVKQKSKAYFNILMCISAETIVKRGYSYSQSDVFILGGIMGIFYPLFTGSFEEREFKVYTLIKKFWIESSLYIFMDVMGHYTNVQQKSWKGQNFQIPPSVYGTSGSSLQMYNKTDGISPTEILPLFILFFWLGNLKSKKYNKYTLNEKKAFCNVFITQVKINVGKYMNGLGGDGTIKQVMVNYLINQDYLYLFSAIISVHTHPTNGIPSFDKIWEYGENEDTFTINPKNNAFFSIESAFSTNMGTVITRDPIVRDKYGIFDLSHVNKVYMFLSKETKYKKKKTTHFVKLLDIIVNKKIIKHSDLTPNEIQELTNISNDNKTNNLMRDVNDNKFYLKPIKLNRSFRSLFSWDKSPKSGGARYTMKTRTKGHYKTRKLY